MFQVFQGLVSDPSTQVHSSSSMTMGIPLITMGLKAREISICHALGIIG